MHAYGQWFVEATAGLARKADRALRETDCASHFVYYKPNGLAFMVVAEGSEAPEGFKLITGERVPSHLTVEQLTYWIRQRAQSVPVLPGD